MEHRESAYLPAEGEIEDDHPLGEGGRIRVLPFLQHMASLR